VSDPEQVWMKLYRNAIVELDSAKLPQRLQAAREAIVARIQTLGGSNDSREERQALQDAQRNLRILQKNEGIPGD